MPLPLPMAFWPLVVTAANGKIDVRRTSDSANFAVTIAAGTYLSPAALASEIQTKLQAAWANTWVVSVSATGRITVAGAAAFRLMFSTGANAGSSARDVLGFGAVDTVSATTTTGQYQHQNGWYAEDPVVDDTGSLPLYDRAQSIAQGGQSYGLDFGTRYQRVISLAFLAAYKTWKADEGTRLNEALERLWDAGWMRLRWWPDASVPGTYEDLVLLLDTAKAMPRKRLSAGNPLYSLELRFAKFVS